MRFEWIVAWRFLREGGLQTALIIVGAALGIAFIVFITGFLGDLQRDIVQRTLGVQPHVTIKPLEEVARPLRPGSAGGPAATSPGGSPQADAQAGAPVVLSDVQPRGQRLRSIDQWQATVARLRENADVRAISPLVSGPGLVTRGDSNKSLSIIGIVAQPYAAVTRLDQKLVAGTLQVDPGDVLLGRDLAEDLGVGVGDTVRLSTPTSAGDTYRVRGIFDLGAKNLNQLYAFVGLATAQALHALPGGVTSIEITVEDLWDAQRVADELSRTIPHLVESWIRTNQQLMVALSNQTLMTRMIRFTFGLVVAIGVASVLMVAVVQKTREIGILRAMGTSRGRVLRVFLVQGAIIGLIGAVLGCAIGYALAQFMSGILTSADGSRLFSAHLDFPLYAYTTIGAVVLGVISAALPARRAARLDPAQAIRM
jgi:lipoprotein-releasing system permease protein